MKNNVELGALVEVCSRRQNMSREEVKDEAENIEKSAKIKENVDRQLWTIR
jgi:hypothetical protein